MTFLCQDGHMNLRCDLRCTEISQCGFFECKITDWSKRKRTRIQISGTLSWLTFDGGMISQPQELGCNLALDKSETDCDGDSLYFIY